MSLFPHLVLEHGRVISLYWVLFILDMTPFLSVINKLFATVVILVVGNSAVALAVGIVVSFVRVTVGTV